jgi:polysaccharide export outer membrane protein
MDTINAMMISIKNGSCDASFTATARVVLLGCALLTNAAIACGQQKLTENPPALRIAAGDLVAVDVFDTPELSAKLRVSEKGDIDLPVAGSLHVGGLTAEQAAVDAEQRLRDDKILKHPHVEVFIQEYATQGVSVLGEVKTPGVYPELGSHTLLDFISVAGGITPTAGKLVSITHKGDPEHPTVVSIDSSPDVAKRAAVAIQPGDTIVVSRSGIVYLVGDLGKPGGFLIENSERLTAVQAVALAQGANKTAALNKSKLIRKTPNGPEEIPVRLGRVLAGKESDPRLEDGDILFVPPGKLKPAAYAGLGYAISLATGMAIYGRY